MDFKRFLIGFLFSVSASAHASTVFMPTAGTGDVNFFRLTLAAGSSLAMFDDSDTSFTAPLAVPLPSLVTISGPDGFGDFTATNISANTLTLTGNNWFILGVNSGGSWSGDTGANCSPTTNSCTVTFADGTVLSVDTQIVPVPAAVWLFGSGLLGLVGVARRRS
jgi:hypothetical protein